MNRKSSFVMVLAMTVTCGTFAQQVYKSIGPDGKTVYSDQPPAGTDAKSTTIGTPAQSPQTNATTDAARRSAEASAAQEARIMGARKAGAKIALPREAPTVEAPGPQAAQALDPAVEKALIGVMGMEDLVLQTESLCLQALPTSFKKYTTSTSNWKQRNAAVLAQQRRVLSEAVSPSQRQLIEGALKVKNQRMLVPIVNAPMASKIKWCDESSDEINGGKMDVYNNEKLAPPLMNYRPKPS
ncbi:MAG: DUF4124 domain-containing protein [Usitatibacter sp.]